jgi:hypothetical protein
MTLTPRSGGISNLFLWRVDLKMMGVYIYVDVEGEVD